MKTVAICVGAGGLAFLLAGFQLGLFDSTSPAVENATVETKKQPPKVESKPRPRFPQDLAPAARAEPVAAAAEFKPKASTHRTVILKTAGGLHPWQDSLPDEWQAERVEDTELVLLLSVQKKAFIDITHYKNGEPPISRYQHTLEASVIEAKTGTVLAYQKFVNAPRPIKMWESWELTAIGHPVQFRTVFQWFVARSRAGFPHDADPPPIVNVVD